MVTSDGAAHQRYRAPLIRDLSPRVDEVPDDLARHCCVGRRQDRVMLERVKLSLGPNLWLPPKSALAGFRFPPEVIVLAGDPATRRP